MFKLNLLNLLFLQEVCMFGYEVLRRIKKDICIENCVLYGIEQYFNRLKAIKRDLNK